MNARIPWIIWAILAVASLLSAQTPAKKPSAKPDTWERSKECAAQAEKVVADWSKRTGSAPEDWQNHYSPKYGKCFVLIGSVQPSADRNSFPTVYSEALFDAFEHSRAIAHDCEVSGHDDCVDYLNSRMRAAQLESISEKLYGKAFADTNTSEKEKVRDIASKVDLMPSSNRCGIDLKDAECSKAKAFISERMKN